MLDQDLPRAFDELAGAARSLTESFESDEGEQSVLDTIVAEAVRAFPDADMASITAFHHGEPETAAHSDPRAVEIDRGQYQAGTGPCLRAAETGDVVRIAMPNAADRFPEFARRASAFGVGSYLAAPLRVDDTLAGALNLFGFGDHGFAAAESHLITVYTTLVSFGLRSARRYRHAAEQCEHLTTAMRSRAVIEQAKGMLMAIHRIDAETAMRRLVTESQQTNTKLRDVAGRFVVEVSGRPRTAD
ncbi:GAF and ANTAR domain-containing protein [Amycolatopsis sp. OK19-0408]|uniref:GAF and ANTAR domain-containing protein n=1 Tax=Amycolatopsis iheyensis TaxID=2945988 RepID=A0A9X2SJ22_9PSEU|nr:GAF and ANTAR domain-containing protein [Amycolatopsis iheyensis]MCR6483563.1 GAF and ANTAR domain-containing protein [Amycolatopsis iheyensis]